MKCPQSPDNASEDESTGKGKSESSRQVKWRSQSADTAELLRVIFDRALEALTLCCGHPLSRAMRAVRTQATTLVVVPQR